LSIPIETLANRARAAKAGKMKKVGRHLKPPTEMEVELAQVKRALAAVKMERD
jgi:transposase